MRDKTFLVMAGGTGGHIYPALATAEDLRARQDKVCWLGSQHGMEERIAERAGIPFYGLEIKGIRGNGLWRKLKAPLQIVRALLQARKVMKEVKPDCVLGMGGFASGPGGIAAKWMGIPLVIHEQNAVAGMTNRLLANIASRVLTAFPDAFAENVEAKMVGNPLRSGICELYYRPRKQPITGRSVRLLVLGGSLGAASLNTCVPEAIAMLPEELRPEIRHQAGKGKEEAARQSYCDAGIKAEVSAFIEAMDEAYCWADFVICRAGALTIAELCVVGLGAILVPYPYAVDDHQTLNARWMEQAGAAWLLPQSKLEPETLAEVLKPLLVKPERISLLAEAAHKLGRPAATEHVADECRSVCYG